MHTSNTEQKKPKYYQPECKCDGTGHICYIRSVPQTIKLDVSKLKNTANGSDQKLSQERGKA